MNSRIAVGSRRGTRPERTRTAIVDQHATWIAVNPVQGCPKGCSYCFLNERGQTAVRPEQLASPAETVDMLTASRYYAPDGGDLGARVHVARQDNDPYWSSGTAGALPLVIGDAG